MSREQKIEAGKEVKNEIGKYPNKRNAVISSDLASGSYYRFNV
jgi:hypothetical protein